VLRATADSNIYISALEFGGQPLRFLELARAGVIELAISDAIIGEVWEVLRDKFRWPPEQLREIEPRLAAFTRRVTPTQVLNVVRSDADDNRILECAVEAESAFLVTGDKDLLRLGRYAGIRIVKVTEFLERAGEQG
jgi:putative PIN family toxin of toxin-antitoxin system